MLGKLLDGRYKVAEVLRAGGFGETYIAEDTRRPGNPKCVLKLLKPASSDAYCLEVARRLFNSEAEILEQLGNHDQIPRLLAYFEENKDFFLVQELIVGRPLSTEMQISQAWTESQVIQMLQDILGVLEFVHSYGVIHRDIKPDNLIRRDKDGKLVLIDFGAVKQMRSQLVASPSQITATVAIGTPGYMPAEQAQGKPRHNSDIYAVGMIAIQAMTGLLPTQFQENQETGEVIWQHQAQVSPGLGAIMQRMVCYHYRDRYQSATEVLQDLQQLTNPLLATQLWIPPTYIYNAAPPSNIPVAVSQQPSSVPVSGAINHSRLFPKPPTWLNPTLSVVRFLPFIGAFGLFLFKAATWLVLLGLVLVAFGAGLFFLRSWYPRLGRDYDAIFAVVFCLSGILLLFQDSRFYGTQEIPIGQSLLAGAGVFSVAECIRLRGR
jgi:serine/threonine-protein kinase